MTKMTRDAVMTDLFLSTQGHHPCCSCKKCIALSSMLNEEENREQPKITKGKNRRKSKEEDSV